MPIRADSAQQNGAIIADAANVPLSGAETVIDDAGGIIAITLGDIGITASVTGQVIAPAISGSVAFVSDVGVTAAFSGLITPPGTIGGIVAFAGDVGVTADLSGVITPNTVTVDGAAVFAGDIGVTASVSGVITPPGSVGGVAAFSESISIVASLSGLIRDTAMIPHTVTIDDSQTLRRESTHFVLPIVFREIDGAAYVPLTAHWRLDDPDSDQNYIPDTEITTLSSDLNLLVPATAMDIADESRSQERRVLTFTTNRGLMTETNTVYEFNLKNLEFV